VQRLITRHKGELSAARERAAEASKAAVEAARGEHEAQTQALRTRLRQVGRGVRGARVEAHMERGHVHSLAHCAV
jgi:hypothetical protein